jgi:hypothetical protein
MIQPVNGDDYHFNLLILIGFLLPKTFKLLKSVKTLKTTTAKKELAPLRTPSRQEQKGQALSYFHGTVVAFFNSKKEGGSTPRKSLLSKRILCISFVTPP